MDVRFDLVVYEEFKKEVIDGVEYCIGLFDKFVGKGEKLFDGEYFVIKYYILIILQQIFVLFNIFYLDESDLLYIDQCICFGKVMIYILGGLKNCILCVMMSFKIELIVEVVVMEMGESVVCRFDFLGIDFQR